eukprot:TRINITY_DN8646_c0_g1_i10.p1 TRINITY_DN8646_c0_g1~~TRINITY_DN8646_c0_g1_i10.p1  ORF type:complete len:299 (+),score=46.92 TRINITY_DN8646_c0_g1_i10:49-945(+)
MLTYVILSICLCSAVGFQMKSAIDLTHPFNENTIAWPANTQFSATQIMKDYTETGIWYEERVISGSEHSGTHLDAPVHLRDEEGGWSAGDIPLNRLAGPGIKIDISEKCLENIDYELTVEDVEAWESKHGQIQEGNIVIVHTDRGKFYTDRDRYLGRPAGMDLPFNDTKHLHFPGISPAAAQVFVDRKVYGVAIDTPSLDYGQSRDFKSHRILLGANIYGIENIANTDKLPAKGFLMNCMVQKLEGGSGGPVRVIAILDKPRTDQLVQEDDGNTGLSNVHGNNIFIKILSVFFLCNFI